MTGLTPQRRRLSRRAFLVTAATATVAIVAGGGYALTRPPRVQSGQIVNAWLSLLDDGRVQFVCPAQNLGQGAPFALALILAEEMGADPARVTVVAAPRDAARYGNPDFMSRMVTADSKTTRGYWPLLRLAGAEARKAMIATACRARGWQVVDCAVQAHAVVHRPSGASMSFGDIARGGRLVLPGADAADLKPAATFTLLGGDAPNPELLDIVTGRKRFGIDRRASDTLVAVLARSPHLGGTVLSVDDAQARAVPGVQDVVRLPDAVAVVATHTWAAIKGRRALRVNWSAPGAFSSASERDKLAQALDDPARPRVLLRQSGQAPARGTRYAASFVVPTLSHVLPEPLNATARGHSLGLGVEVSGSTQSPDLDMRFAAKAWKTAPPLVTHQSQPSGGAYGRRVLNDAVRDACTVAKKLGRPVQVIRPLGDELRRGQVRPAALQRIAAELDEGGMLKSWHHELASDGTLATQLPSSLKGANNDEDNTATDGARHPYRVSNEHISWTYVPSEPTPGFLRGVAAAYTVWAIEATVERLAHAAGVDPLQWRLRHVDDERLARALKAVAGLARWGEPGRHLGMALMAFRGSAIACVAEVCLGRVAGLWLAADVGQVVHRGQVLGQIEGGAVWGLSMALWEHLDYDHGAAQAEGLGQYPLPTLADLPPIRIELLPPVSETPPCGAGEVGVPTVVAAVCNAFERAGGRRQGRLPLQVETVAA